MEQLSLNFKLGDWEAIQKHVEFRYKIIRNELLTNEAKLKEVINIVKMKNPSLISQINKAAMISEPYHVRMQERNLNIGGGAGGAGGYAQSQNSARSIKSRAFSSYSKATTHK